MQSKIKIKLSSNILINRTIKLNACLIFYNLGIKYIYIFLFVNTSRTQVILRVLIGFFAIYLALTITESFRASKQGFNLKK